MKTRAFTSALFLLNSLLFAQNLSIEWDHTVGGYHGESPFTSLKTSDGNYVIAGFSGSDAYWDKSDDSFGEGDYWIVKLDETGEVIWDATYGGDEHELPYHGIETTDGGFLFVGDSQSGISGSKTEERLGFNDIWLIKINALGELEWERTLGGDGKELGLYVLEVEDENIMVFGSSDSDISGNKTENAIGEFDFWLIKLDRFGTILWDKTIGGNHFEAPFAAHQTLDGDFIIIGNSESDISGDKTEPNVGSSDLWMIKTDADGNVLWDRTYGGSDIDNTSSYLLPASDGSYVLSALSYSPVSGNKTDGIRGDGDCWIIKVNADGDVLWDKTIGGDETDIPVRVVNSPDGGYLLAASSISDVSFEKTSPSKSPGFTDVWLVKLDDVGGIVWDTVFGGDGIDALADLQVIEDGYLVTTYSESNAGDDKSENPIMMEPYLYDGDYWVFKLADCAFLSSGVDQIGSTLIAEEDDVSYQWVDCDHDFAPVDGANEQSFTPETEGNYAVIVTDGPCEKMSDCYFVSTSGLNNFNGRDQFSIYPNPAQDIVRISGDFPSDAQFLITSLPGQVCLSSTESLIDIHSLPSGFYLLSLVDKDGVTTATRYFVKR